MSYTQIFRLLRGFTNPRSRPMQLNHLTLGNCSIQSNKSREEFQPFFFSFFATQIFVVNNCFANLLFRLLLLNVDSFTNTCGGGGLIQKGALKFFDLPKGALKNIATNFPRKIVIIGLTMGFTHNFHVIMGDLKFLRSEKAPKMWCDQAKSV